jgi:NCS2 family nucleobase:cation symporter-2
MSKPDTIIYGTEDRPPTFVVLLLSIQHVMILSIFLIAPVLVARAAKLSIKQAIDFISLTMIALGVGTLLQVRRWGPVGSGLLAIPNSTSNWVPGCLIAAREGGLPAVAGLILMAATFEMILSRFLRKLRGLLPTELSGLVVFVTGLGVAQAGMNNIVGDMTTDGSSHWLPSLLVSMGTLATTVGFSVWGRGPVNTIGAILGLVGGYIASLATGLVDSASLETLAHAPLIAIPSITPVLPSFDTALLLPSLITGLVILLNSIGALTAAQKLNDGNWNRQDLGSLSRGLLADGMAAAISALIGGGGIAMAGSSVSLTAAARATSDDRLCSVGRVSDPLSRAEVLGADPQRAIPCAGSSAGVPVMSADDQRHLNYELSAAGYTQDFDTWDCFCLCGGYVSAGPGGTTPAVLDGSGPGIAAARRCPGRHLAEPYTPSRHPSAGRVGHTGGRDAA